MNKKNLKNFTPSVKAVCFAVVTAMSFPALVTATEENSSPDTIGSMVARPDGYHTIIPENTNLPNSDVCTFADRAVLQETDAASRTMIAFALSAMLSKSQVILRTSGCIETKTDSSNTAPKVIKVKILAPN